MTSNASFDSRSFRNALGSFATGVTIVTTRDADGKDVGLTANSFNSVSLDPPMVLWSLAKTSAALPAFMESAHFAVHILSAEQEALSNTFSRRGIDKFAGVEVARGIGGVALLAGCSAYFECKTTFRYEGGDHVIFVGEVVGFTDEARAPLVYHSGGYGLVVKKQVPPPAHPGNAREGEGSFNKNFLGYLLGASYQQVFQPIRKELDALDLSEDDYLVLSILGIGDDRSLAELDTLLSISGRSASAEVREGLCRRGLLRECAGADGAPRLTLTEAGRALELRLLAVAKLAEATAESALDYSEVQLLKQLLKRIVRKTAVAPQLLWK
ncbi:flavin reductase [Massilia putida]|uniref:flavin reductase n=1 Tax=Massilia putida TaxID=1141883 RepID=UPI000953565E|nr:flavin reductase [Massilia putida]